MRMWRVDKRILCRMHLLGEHNECHSFLGTLKKKIKMDGYIRNNLLEPRYLQKNHEELSLEMVNRGYNHKSNLEVKEDDVCHLSAQYKNHKIDSNLSLLTLLSRCEKCKDRYEKLVQNNTLTS